MCVCARAHTRVPVGRYELNCSAFYDFNLRATLP